MRRLAIILVAVLAALVTTGGTAAADGDHEFGPYAVVSPDSGTCGNDWATDTFTRRFIVKSNGNGTFNLRVINTDGTFVTNAGVSPGACEASGRHGATIRAGVTGKMHGTLEGTVYGGVFDPAATCGDPCFMSVFTSAFFGGTATFSCLGPPGSCRFSFEYSSGDKDLSYRHWKNADNGNKGDIAD